MFAIVSYPMPGCKSSEMKINPLEISSAVNVKLTDETSERRNSVTKYPPKFMTEETNKSTEE